MKAYFDQFLFSAKSWLQASADHWVLSPQPPPALSWCTLAYAPPTPSSCTPHHSTSPGHTHCTRPGLLLTYSTSIPHRYGTLQITRYHFNIIFPALKFNNHIAQKLDQGRDLFWIIAMQRRKQTQLQLQNSWLIDFLAYYPAPKFNCHVAGKFSE